jgi:hypothetical protein
MRGLRIILVGLFALSPAVRAQTPDGFRWIDLKSDSATVATVRHALKNNAFAVKGYTFNVIRKIGVKDGFALVMAVSHAGVAAAPATPDTDCWIVLYSVSLTTGKTQPLVEGIYVQLYKWIGKDSSELALSYVPCFEDESDCEEDLLFTTLHLVPGIGWRARWPNDDNYFGSRSISDGHPPGGNVGCGEPEGGETYDSLFAVVRLEPSGFAAGNWCRTKFWPSGSITDGVARYSIDPATGKDMTEKLTGAKARAWERELCSASSLVTDPNLIGDSSLCRAIASSSVNRPAPHQ